jgi:hypothetical protein
MKTIREQAAWIKTKIIDRFVNENIDSTEMEFVAVDVWCDAPPESVEMFAVRGFEEAIKDILRDLGGGGTAISLDNVSIDIVHTAIEDGIAETA